MSRELVVSAGDNAPHVMRVTDRMLGDLSGCTWKVQLMPGGAHPTSSGWSDPDDVTLSTCDGSSHQNVADVAMNINSSNAPTPGDYRMWVQLTDGPNVFVLPDVEIVHAV